MKYFSSAAVAGVALLSLAAIPARGAVHQVTVGGTGILKYDPESVNADPGDTVLFTFKQKNHTATQSTFDSPCELAPNGFDSGFQFVADNNTDGPFPQAQLTVVDTNPIWVYCRQTGHCQQGMVFAVNPGDKFAQFQANANGTTTNTTTSAAATTTAAASGSVVTVTATVTVSGGDVVTTTYGSYPGSAEPTSASSTNHLITVGGADLVFSPANISAQVGDTITFQFMQKNHTVTQSSFAAPCRSLTSTSTTGQIGFDSGFMPVAANATTFPTFTVTVNDSAPIWAYCRQANHCGQGMVFAANAIESGSNNFEAFVALAKQLNGTGTGSSTNSSSSSSSANGAGAVHVTRGAGVAVSAVALLFGLLL